VQFDDLDTFNDRYLNFLEILKLSSSFSSLFMEILQDKEDCLPDWALVCFQLFLKCNKIGFNIFP